MEMELIDKNKKYKVYFSCNVHQSQNISLVIFSQLVHPQELGFWNVTAVYLFVYLTEEKWVSFKDLRFYEGEGGFKRDQIRMLIDLLSKTDKTTVVQ